MEDFGRYLRKIGDKYEAFERDREASSDTRVARKVTLNSGERPSSCHAVRHA